MNSAPTTRIKKSYSLSRESEQFIRRVRQTRNIASDSEALDQILRESLQNQSRASIDAAYTAFYDAASPAELAEESTWAEFAERELTHLAQ
jgi:hypothetical protein